MSREMKHSGIDWIGDIPEHWEVCKLKNQFRLLNGRAYAEPELLENGKYRILRVGNLFSSDKWYFSDLELEDNKYCESGDLLYGWSASIGAYIWKGEKVIYHYHIWKVLFGDNNLHFSYYLLHALTIAKQQDMHGSAMQHLTKINMDNSKIVIPPLSEQQKIADYLDKVCGEIDGLVALQEAMIDELKAYKQSVITEAVTRGLNPNVPLKPSGIDWIGDIPEHWDVVPFKWVLRNPLQYGANESGSLYEHSLPRYVRITDILNNELREDLQKQSLTEEQAKGFILEDNDILFARSGGTVGKAFIYKRKYGRCAFAGYLIRAQVNSNCCPDFVFYYTQSRSYDEWKRQIFIQATIQNIGADRYSLMDLPIPPLSEQQQIASFLDTKCSEIDSLIAIKQQKIEELKDYKKSVIYEYVTGKKEVV